MARGFCPNKMRLCSQVFNGYAVENGSPNALLALLKAGNCHSPYLDTVENGSTLEKSGIHDTQFDAKAPKPTPKNRKIDTLEKSLNDRLCRAK